MKLMMRFEGSMSGQQSQGSISLGDIRAPGWAILVIGLAASLTAIWIGVLIWLVVVLLRLMVA